VLDPTLKDQQRSSQDRREKVRVLSQQLG